MPPVQKLNHDEAWLEMNGNARYEAAKKLTARLGDDLLFAYILSGVNPAHANPNYEVPGREGASYGTNFVRRPIEKFNLLEAIEEAVGTDVFVMRSREHSLRRKDPFEMFGNLPDNVQWVVKVLLGLDPLTGELFHRSTPPPHVELQKEILRLQGEGVSAADTLSGDAQQRAEKAASLKVIE